MRYDALMLRARLHGRMEAIVEMRGPSITTSVAHLPGKVLERYDSALRRDRATRDRNPA